MNKQQQRQGVFFALAAYLIWGIAPLYFKSIQQVPAGEILAHRVIWSFFFMLILLTASHHWSHVKQVFAQKKKLLLLFVTSIAIGSNWLLFIWAINNGHLLEASLGYFINPLINVLLGMIFLGERFRRLQWMSVVLALSGVLVQVWQFGSVPIVGLGLALSFGLYGLLRKKVVVDAQTGLFFETLWLLPLAVLYLFVFADSTTSHLVKNSLTLNVLLFSAGMVTTIPLLFFTAAAARLRLSTLGLFQYLGPTLMFILAVSVFGETMGQDKVVTFICIWCGLLVFVFDAIKQQRRQRH